MAELDEEIRETVRARYAAAASAVSEARAGGGGCCAGPGEDSAADASGSGGCGSGAGVSEAGGEGTTAGGCGTEAGGEGTTAGGCGTEAGGEGTTAGGCGTEVAAGSFGAALYESDQRESLPEAAKLVSLGCGNPTAVAELREGETVLDLGSGGGIDVLLSARRVGPTGRAFGLDMTDEMLDLARRNRSEAGIENAEFLKGTIEDIPLPDSSVDAVISNCVINLSADKPAVLREAARVLRPGGRFAVSDVIADPGMDEATRRDMAQWTGCIAGALTAEQFREELVRAGFEEVEIEETHRVHDQAASALIRARKPPR
ncbi:MAG: arsenite methyltransferase [Solirubrobacterales bacterium]